ncbi:MAG: hypothetical protein EBE86_029740 [Hormoscilla sp. GUM202]|nr:hypothetical protein [Hormoscilla sp. GUM202]
MSAGSATVSPYRLTVQLPRPVIGDRAIGEIRELRSIENRLAAIAVLADSDKCVLPPEIKAWLSLREKLP